MATSLMNTMISLGDTTRGVKWREEDMRHRGMVYKQFMITQKDRVVDLRTKGLDIISNHSALIAGFTIVMFVELEVPEDTPSGLVVAYGITTALTCCILGLTMIQTMLVMNVVSIRSQLHDDKKSFNAFWLGRIHDKWVRMFMWFCAAIPLFLIDLALVGWIKFIKTPSAAIAITAIVSLTCVLWLADQCYWGTYISTVLDFKDENAGDHLVKGSGFDTIEMASSKESSAV